MHNASHIYSLHFFSRIKWKEVLQGNDFGKKKNNQICTEMFETEKKSKKYISVIWQTMKKYTTAMIA